MIAPKKLKRYIKIESLKEIISTGKLKFSDPQYWDDLNDKELLEIYCTKKKISKVLVLCFSCEDETIHFWKSYAGKDSGCCVNFFPKYLLDLFENNSLTHNFVRYEKIKDAILNNHTIDDIPFMKRHLYRIEEEYRVLYENKKSISDFCLDIEIDKSIESIVLSHKAKESEKSEIRKLWNTKV